MSLLKVKGNASGTGTVTLTAPNTSTDRTITLPDGDATLATNENFTSTGIDDNATTNTLSISNNLLKITNGDGLNIQLAKGTRFGYSSAYRVLQLGSGGGGNNETLSLNYDPSGNPSGSFTGTGNEVLMKNTTRFLTPNTSNNGFHGVMDFIDGNVSVPGYVLTPNQPAFDAYHSPSGSYSSGTTVTSLDLNATRLNKGNHYNTSNDRFVAPVAGVYQFNYRCIVNGATNNMHVRMQVNGINMSGSDTHHSAGAGTGWGQLVIQMIVNLSANDYIQVFPANDRGIYGGSYQSFNGHLIG